MTALISQRTRYRLICGYRVIATLEFGNTATFYLPPLIAAFEKALGDRIAYSEGSPRARF